MSMNLQLGSKMSSKRYKLSNSLTKLTVSQVIERLSVAWTEDLSHELLNFYFLTLRASLELRMISI